MFTRPLPLQPMKWTALKLGGLHHFIALFKRKSRQWLKHTSSTNLSKSWLIQRLYASAMALHGRWIELDVKCLMKYELASHPANDARYSLWMKKVSKNIANAPKLQSLPPTDKALFQNVVWARIQVDIWKNSLKADPPPTEDGWYKEEGLNSLAAIMLPPNTPLAPDALLKIIKCSCKGEEPCNTRKCSRCVHLFGSIMIKR